MGNRDSRLGVVKLTAVLVLAACVLALIYYRDRLSIPLPPCPFRTLTGLHCPGCGSMRATYQLLHGNLAAALGLNPLLIVMSPFLMYGIAAELSALIKPGLLPVLSPSARGIWALLGVIAVYWVLRNIPVYPFSQLAP